MRYLIFIAMFLLLAGTALAVDTNPPLISSINVINIGIDRATIVWYTDEPSNSYVETDTNIFNDTNLVTNHSVRLINLAPEKEYLYNLSSCDQTGNCASASGTALKFTTFPLYLGEQKDITASNASRLIKASSSKSYLVDFREANPFEGGVSLRSGFLFSSNGSDYGFIITKMGDGSIDVTLVPNTNISTIRLNQTRVYDLNNDTMPDVEFTLEGTGKRLVVGDQGISYVEYYANVSIKSLEVLEEKHVERPRVDFTENIVPYKFASGPDKEGKIDIFSRLLPKEGGSVFVGVVIFVLVLGAGLLILWIFRQ